MRKLKVASFNISGGFYIGNEKTEYLDRKAVKSFDDIMIGSTIDFSSKVIKILSDHFFVLTTLDLN